MLLLLVLLVDLLMACVLQYLVSKYPSRTARNAEIEIKGLMRDRNDDDDDEEE